MIAGAFNAAIFSPGWLLVQKLIGESEYAAADIEISTREIAVFTLRWLKVQVTPDNLLLAAADPEEYVRLRDIAVGVLRALSHTPIASMTITHEAHFPTDSVTRWHAIGDAVIPKPAWSELLVNAGTRAASVQGARPDLHGGHQLVQVEPSYRVPVGVFVAFADHYTLSDVESVIESREDPDFMKGLTATVQPDAAHVPAAIEILESEWTVSEDRARWAYRTVMALGDQQ